MRQRESNWDRNRTCPNLSGLSWFFLSGTNFSKFFSKFVHKFIGHKERITGLSWSANNLLASCSFDSTVQIWNTDSGKPLANYRGHSEKLLCCLFSNSDSNIVYSGGEDYCLHKWKIDAQSEIMPPEECKYDFNKCCFLFISPEKISDQVYFIKNPFEVFYVWTCILVTCL
jgi:WD40 repeat protein